MTVGATGGLVLAGCDVPSGLSVPAGAGVVGASVTSTGDHTVTGSAILLGNKHSTGTGRAVTITDATGYLSIASAQQTGIKMNQSSLGLYNANGAAWDPTSGSASGNGTSMVLGSAAIGPLAGSAELQARASGTNILDLAPTIHHNLFPIEM